MENELQRLRELATAIVGAKRARPEDAGAAAGKQSLQELATGGLLQILDVKEANKRLCARVEAAKEETGRTKLSLDGSDSTLQNLLYEKGYYEKEILACRSFVSKVKDEAVALMPEAQFWQAVQSSGATPEEQELAALAAQSAHELAKARLVHEQRLRQQLVKRLDELKQQRETSQEQVAAQQKALNDLQVPLRRARCTGRTTTGRSARAHTPQDRQVGSPPAPLIRAPRRHASRRWRRTPSRCRWC